MHCRSNVWTGCTGQSPTAAEERCSSGVAACVCLGGVELIIIWQAAGKSHDNKDDDVSGSDNQTCVCVLGCFVGQATGHSLSLSLSLSLFVSLSLPCTFLLQLASCHCMRRLADGRALWVWANLYEYEPSIALPCPFNSAAKLMKLARVHGCQHLLWMSR